MIKAVVLISGNGSNLQAIIDNNHQKDIDIVAVISNQADAYGLLRAKSTHITTQVIESETQLLAQIDTKQADLIILAGFMKILSATFIQKYLGKILNIHPSLLPKFKGINTHTRVLEAQEKEHGASVHFVNNELDSGAIIAQSIVPIYQDDTPKILADRVLKKEHSLYPTVIRWFATNRLTLNNNQAYLDEKPILNPIII